jgi:hypothetical protein
MLLFPDCRLDDSRMEGVRNQTNDQIVLGNLGVESLLVGYVQGNWSCELDAF